MSRPSNELVLQVIAALERENIPYMLVGSYSSNTYGIARSTADADFVIELGNRSIEPIVNALADTIRLDPQLIFESVTMTSRFIGKHKTSGFTIELFLLADKPFDQARFQRRMKQPFLDTMAWLPTAEDVIIQKLHWFSRARRAKDLDDARNVLAVQLQKLDLAYIRDWCDKHDTLKTFEDLLAEAKKFEQPE